MLHLRDLFFSLSPEKKRAPYGQELFVKIIKDYYAKHKRHFSWRETENPYYIFVSEVMLQQTQTARVIDKYAHFIRKFPDFKTLAEAPLVEVLAEWQGLGYNRRGKYLKQSAQLVTDHYMGKVPDDPEVLIDFPGIGPNTAASIITFSYNKPIPFIETNVRSVYLHFFFQDQTGIHDKELFPFIESTLDQKNPRDWYYALMDYGVMLKKQHVNPSRKSKHHAKQSKFEGSDRQIRGAIVKTLTLVPAQIEGILIDQICLHPQIQTDPERVARILEDLIDEKLVSRSGELVSIAHE